MKGKTKNTLFGIAAVLVIALVLVIGWKVAFPQATIGGVNPPTSGGGGAGTTIITTSSTLSLTGYDALASGSNAGVTTYIRTNGVGAFKTGITTANPGDTIDLLLVNDTDYHNLYVPSLKVEGVAFTRSFPMFANTSSLTITVFNTNGQPMDGTNYNQTVAAGGSYNLKMRLDGIDKTSTQDMRCVFESNASTNLSDIIVSGLGAVRIGATAPSFYTLGSTSGRVWSYDISPVVGAVSPEGTVAVVSAVAKSVAKTSLNITCYTKEYFLDEYTGLVSYDVQNSAGTKKSMNSYNEAIYFD